MNVLKRPRSSPPRTATCLQDLSLIRAAGSTQKQFSSFCTSCGAASLCILLIQVLPCGAPAYPAIAVFLLGLGRPGAQTGFSWDLLAVRMFDLLLYPLGTPGKTLLTSVNLCLLPPGSSGILPFFSRVVCSSPSHQAPIS